MLPQELELRNRLDGNHPSGRIEPPPSPNPTPIEDRASEEIDVQSSLGHHNIDQKPMRDRESGASSSNTMTEEHSYTSV